jgi:hypothetical protein
VDKREFVDSCRGGLEESNVQDVRKLRNSLAQKSILLTRKSVPRWQRQFENVAVESPHLFLALE